MPRAVFFELKKPSFCQSRVEPNQFPLIKKGKLQKYFGGFLSIIIDETDLETKTNQLVNDIGNFNNKHIIQCWNKTIFNIPEEPRYI